MSVLLRPCTISDLQAIVGSIGEFWDGRDAGFLHQAYLVHEFGDTALVAEDSGAIAGYLCGFVTQARTGYIHVVAVRPAWRGGGVARLLYERFAVLAAAGGARRLKAITSPGNSGSIAFHRSLGFDAEEVASYSVGGAARIVFDRALPADGRL